MSPLGARAAAIAVRARTLDELLGSAAQRDAPAPEEARRQGSQILDRWRFSVAQGDPERFARRLAWDGLEVEEVSERLAWSLARPTVPPWADRLEELLAAVAGDPPGERSDAETTPFGDLWRVVARRWRVKLVSDRVVAQELTSSACDDLEDHLLQQLSRVSREALWERLAAVRPDPNGIAAGAHRHYDSFVTALGDGGLVEVCEELPVLARQLVRLLDTWLESGRELAARLAAARCDVERVLGGGRPAGPVVRILTGLSDRHRGGRRVQLLELESGLRVIFKPRDIAVEAAFNGLLAALAEAGLEEAPPHLRSVVGDGHGFVEVAVEGEPADEEAVRRWFRRAGALAAVVRLLRAVDLHMDNLVATPDGPVVVDSESILQPDWPDRPAADSGPDPDSVLHSGLVSFLTVGPRGGVAEIGGLCGRGGHLAVADERQWLELGTDRMAPVLGDRRAAAERNLVRLGGRLQPAEHFAGEIADGFAAAHRFLRRHRGELLARGGPFSRLGGVKVRTLLRDSNQYAAVMAATMTPRFQHQGWATGVLADSVNRGAVAGGTPPALWPATAAERRALDGLDIPLLQVDGSGTGLEADDGVRVSGLYPRPAASAVLERLRLLDESDLERQLDRLGWVLSRHEVSDAALADPLVRTAEIIAQRLLERAVAADGRLVRVAVDPDRPSDPVVELSLYDGAAGVAAFLATAAAVTGVARFAGAAHRMAAPIAGWLAAVDHGAAAAPPLGACHGLGGLVWTGAVVGRLLDDAWWLELGRAAALQITDERALTDHRLDVEGGAAGAILGLLALYRETSEPWLLERAVVCGQRLLAAATPAANGGAGWPDGEGIMRAGFAHGAAGVAAALARLAVATGFRPFLEAAADGVAFERGLYDRRRKNWPVEVRAADGGRRTISMCAWCHGAPGVLLGRLALLEALPEEALRAELTAASATTLAAGLGRSDHLCCGTMGRVDALLTAGLRLGETPLLRAAASRAVMGLRRAMSDGGFRFDASDDGVGRYAPGLFRGEAGVGYQLLRLARPDRVPSLLAFEPVGPGGNGQDTNRGGAP